MNPHAMDMNFITVYVDVCTDVMNTENNFLNVFPIPVSSLLNVQLHAISPGTVTIELIDMLGRTVKHVTWNSANTNEPVIQLNVTGLPDGKYMLLVKTENEFLNKRIVVSH
jgi:hypothetical protein